MTEESTFFDFGCGRGDDLRILKKMGFQGDGWDPVHRSDGKPAKSEIVNIGYVVNVIEDPDERTEAIQKAWSLTEEVLIVSGRLVHEAKSIANASNYADGIITSRGTFQKFFEQHELRAWIDQALDAKSHPAGPGIFYIFRSEERRTAFMASRYRRHVLLPRMSRAEAVFEANEERLRPLINFMTSRGRLPATTEIPNAAEIEETFGSLKRAFKIVERATDAAPWDEIAQARAQDLLIYLALARFDGRPSFSRLPEDIQQDIKVFFGTYASAVRQADTLLFSVGNIESLSKACEKALVGKLTPEALYVHTEALDVLSPVLRIYEGCARNYIGQIPEANIIKFNRKEPRISYLIYPDFEKDPHPSLAASLSVHLQTFRIKSRDYTQSSNPPILHRKETFVSTDYPLRSKFARLTESEVSKGLFENPTTIGTKNGWLKVLSDRGLTLKGHRLIRRNSGV